MLKGYRISSPEGQERFGEAEGTYVHLELDQEQERALVAAGWIEEGETDDNIAAMNRDDLNKLAQELGVESPDTLPNKKAVLDAIESAQKEG